MTFLSVANTLSQTLLTLSPYVILFETLKRSRNALYFQSEVLLLLCITYVGRYFAIFFSLLSLEHTMEKLHLNGLFAATYIVLKHNESVYVAPPPVQSVTEDIEPLLTSLGSDADTPLESDKPVTPCSELVSDPMDWNAGRTRGIRIQPFTLWFPLGCAFFMSFLDDYSILNHTFKYLNSLPNTNSLYDDTVWQFFLFGMYLEWGAFIMLWGRLNVVYGVEKKETIDMHPLKRAMTEEEIKKGYPMFGWAFIWLFAVGATLRIPQVFVETLGIGPEVSLGPLLHSVVSMNIPFNLAIFILFVKLSQRRKKAAQIQ